MITHVRNDSNVNYATCFSEWYSGSEYTHFLAKYCALQFLFSVYLYLSLIYYIVTKCLVYNCSKQLNII